MLKGKKVLLGITGGIAAYKCCELIRLLRKSGAEVQAMVTRHALDFVTLTVLKALTSNEPLWDGDSGRLPIEHIRAAEWADLILVAPATGNFLAKVRAGIADDLLSTTVLAGWQKLAVAPACPRNELCNVPEPCHAGEHRSYPEPRNKGLGASLRGSRLRHLGRGPDA